MSNFKVFYKLSDNEPHKWTAPIYFRRPEIVDIMEFDGTQLRTPKNLRYFKNPRAALYPLDLNEGFDDYKFRNESYFKKPLHKIENYVIKGKFKKIDPDTETICKIYTTRSALYGLMLTPYRLDALEFNSDTIFATKFNDIVYLSRNGDNVDQKTVNLTHHFKFQQYCFSDLPNTEPITNVPIDENIQTNCIFRSRVKNFEITYSAEINGVASKQEINDLNSMDAINKCSFVLTKLLPELKFSWLKHKRVLNFWIQAYLSRTDDIYIGFKDRNGRVHAPITHVAVRDLLKDQQWKPHVCIGFLHSFLNKVKAEMSHVNCPHTVYEFQFDSAQKSINYRIHEGQTEYSFLTDQFIDHLQNHRA